MSPGLVVGWICDGVSRKLNTCRGLKVKSVMYRQIVGPGIFPGDHRSALENA